MMLSPDEVQAIASNIIARSGAEACTVSVRGGDSRNFRFARNEATTNGAVSSVSVSIESSFGKRTGSASVNALDEGALDEARLRSEEIALLSPENPEFMPPLGPQTYEPEAARYDAATAHTQASSLAHAAASAIAAGRNYEVGIAGFIEAECGFRALADSAGLFAYDRGTSAELTVTARHTKRAWSGWAGASQNRFRALDPAGLGERAVRKSLFPGEAADLDPGAYTVILEPAATADLVQRLVYSMAARSADEGRSFLSKPGGGTKLGERLLDEAVTITSDPANPDAPDMLFGPDGVPKRRTVWFERGVAKTMSYSRFWAAKNGPRAGPLCLQPIHGGRRGSHRGHDPRGEARRPRHAPVVCQRCGPAHTALHRHDAGWQFPDRKWQDRAARAQPSFQRKPAFRAEQDRSRGTRRAPWRRVGHGLGAAAPDIRVYLLIEVERHLSGFQGQAPQRRVSSGRRRRRYWGLPATVSGGARSAAITLTCLQERFHFPEAFIVKDCLSRDLIELQVLF